MRILVTGITGVIGRLLARQLVAAGNAVSGIAEYPHDYLDPAVDFVQAPLDDPVLQELADDADTLVHLAPVDTSAPAGTGIQGVVHVTDAAARAGARLLFVSRPAATRAVPSGGNAGVQRMDAQPDHPDRPARGPPAGLDGVPHGGHVAARQAVVAAGALVACRRPDPLPRPGGGYQSRRLG
ncbi:NAD dependent epimerase/dehydratase family protein [Mycobacterium xenopi 4042]|uniref:NAD dependent epimerase/dehydratase family protein n=1 Tax=Mycobacterium xenopi 4042 TaxID=1299334 RepID=X8BGE2_MYCXE|nr:NAD dependent epimerase/dehydratase family protein [Mycobacterium xenopi 4042]